ncbi:MAG: hypothetical protein Q8R96_02940 [Bacteroidota bacterium]|nr:hypothetical protein [Bacteroidota bacterium]
MYGDQDDIYDDNEEMSELENLGFDPSIINFVDPGDWLCHENYIFDFRGRLVRKYDFHIDNSCIITNNPFDNGVSFVVDDPTKTYGDRKYALMDFYGNNLTDFFDSIDEGWLDDTYISVERNGKWGYIDKSGRQVTDFRFDWCGMDYEWINQSSIYEIVRIKSKREGVDNELGLFTFTGILALEPIYKEIEIKSKYYSFENGRERTDALLKDVIFATDFDDNKFRWTHHHGLEQI